MRVGLLRVLTQVEDGTVLLSRQRVVGECTPVSIIRLPDSMFVRVFLCCASVVESKSSEVEDGPGGDAVALKETDHVKQSTDTVSVSQVSDLGAVVGVDPLAEGGSESDCARPGEARERWRGGDADVEMEWLKTGV